MKIEFDTSNNPISPTFLLATKNGKILGGIESFDAVISDSISISEITFNTYKTINGRKNYLWNKIDNFKLVWCKEQNEWFEITVEIDEQDNCKKTVIGKSLGIAELSQIILHNIEINTEVDISRDDYKPTVLYNPNDTSSSLLNRITEKAPHYFIKHIDDSIKDIQRTFNFDNISIYDALQEIAKEINCIVRFNAEYADNILYRYISIYDLETVCIDCGNRDEFGDICPKCGSNNLKYGFGDDTTIFITADELTDEINFTTDTDSVKNCFYLEAGDDLMTSTVRNCNPNGTNYLWYISNITKEDMSIELNDKIEQYDRDYSYYQNDADIYLQYESGSVFVEYNNLIAKYRAFSNQGEINAFNFEQFPYRIANKNEIFKYDKTEYHIFKGYVELMKTYYDTVDLTLFLTSELMPKPTETTAEKQSVDLTKKNLSPVSVTTIENQNSVEKAIEELAMYFVDPRYTVGVEECTSYRIRNDGRGEWDGTLRVTNKTDETDTFVTNPIHVYVTNGMTTLTKRRLQKILCNNNTDNLNVTGLFAMEIDDFQNVLYKYSLNRLKSFCDAGQACLDILVEQGMGDNETWANTTPNMYKDLYVPYLNKVELVKKEIELREFEISTVKKLQDGVVEQRNIIQTILNFENYLGTNLWLEFSSYRREDSYQNSNYISNGLNNTELFNNAVKFIDVATKDIQKSATLQHSITTSLYNLLGIEKFKRLLQNFEIGNWMRIRVDDNVFKLRLIEYKIDFNDFNKITVEFSDVTNINNDVNSISGILTQASSMATSYDSVKRQAGQGEESKSTLVDWSENGVNTSNVKLVNSAENQTQTWDSHGILLKEYDSNTDTYSDTQMKIINSTIAITNDNWNTTKTAIGKFYYIDPDTNEIKLAYGVNGETVIGRLLIGETLGLYNESNTLKFDKDGLVVTNNINTITINPNNESIFNISNADNDIFKFDENGNLIIVGNITAESLTLAEGVNIDPSKVKNLATVATTGDYSDLENTPDLSDVAISGSYNDLTDTPEPVDISNKLDKPTNDKDATVNQIIARQEDGSSLWTDISSIFSSDNNVGNQIKNILTIFIPMLFNGCICQEIGSWDYYPNDANSYEINKQDYNLTSNQVLMIWHNGTIWVEGSDYSLIDNGDYWSVKTTNSLYGSSFAVQVWTVSQNKASINTIGQIVSLAMGANNSTDGISTEIEEEETT